MPIIFAGDDVDYASVDEANEILGQIMTLSNTINAAVLDPPTLLPADCQLRDDVLANFEDDAPIAQWPRLVTIESIDRCLTRVHEDGMAEIRSPPIVWSDSGPVSTMSPRPG